MVLRLRALRADIVRPYVLGLVVITIVIAGCGGWPARPPVSPTVPVLPAEVQLEELVAPAAPVLSVADSAVTNVVCTGDCYVGGRASWVTSDAIVGWSHEDPLAVDYYEVWTAVDEPYFDPDACSGCELAGETTGLSYTVVDAPPGFNPVGGTEGESIMSRIQTFQVRGVNGAGASVSSNEIGVVHYSLLQGAVDVLEP